VNLTTVATWDRGSSVVSELFETRSVRETASESGTVSLLILIAVFLPVLEIAGTKGVRPAIEWTVAAGRLLSGQVGWTLTIYVTVLLAFYAVSIGGQILGDANAAARTRRVLGFIAELMAAATLALVVFVAIYCWRVPSMWVIFLVLVPVVGIILFLALQLGSFLVPAREVRIANAKRASDQAREQLRRVRRRSRHRFWLVWVANSAVIAAIGLLVSLPANLTGPAALQLCIYYVITAAVLLAADAYSLHEFLGAHDVFSRVTTWVKPFVLYSLVGVLLVSGKLRLPVPIGWSFVAVMILTLTTTFLPRARASRVVIEWSMQGASAKWAAKSLAKKYSKAVREYRELQASQPAAPRLLRRIRDALRPPLSGS
jgi:hypothetical protein